VSALDPFDRDALRALVREALRDALPGIAADLPAGKADVRWVELRGDDDLDRLVAEVVRIADDPQDGPRLRDGRLRFRLRVPSGPATPGRPERSEQRIEHRIEQRNEQRIDRGAVTERHVRAAEAHGRRLVLGPAAVLTPMARDRARTAGVEIVRERKGQS
jgi:hypothetical protein